MPYATLINISGGIYGVVSAGRKGEGILLDCVGIFPEKTKVGGVTIYAIYLN